jgi:hypothetical protein
MKMPGLTRSMEDAIREIFAFISVWVKEKTEAGI